MTEQSSDANDETRIESVQSEVLSDVEYEGEGEILAGRTAEQGDRRLVWKIGYKEGDFAEATDLYHKGELLDEGKLRKMPENAPSGTFDENGDFRPLENMGATDDGEIVCEYGPATDGVEWAVEYLEGGGLTPETLLDEIWENMKEQYDEGTL